MRSAELYTVVGERVLQATGATELSYANLGRGIYFAKIRTDRGAFESKCVKND